MTKPLQPGEIRTVTTTDGRQAKIMHAAGGALFYVEIRTPGHPVEWCEGYRFESDALRKFAELANA